MPLDDYSALIQSGMQLVPDYNKQLAFKVGLDAAKLQNKQQEMQLRAAEEETRRTALFQSDLQAMLANPTARNVSSLMMKYPEQAEKLKQGWEVKDKAVRDGDFTQLSEIWSALDNGHPELAAKTARQRYDADLAAGNADEGDKTIVDLLESGDPDKINQAKGMIGMHVSALAGPEHFGSVTGALKGGYTLGPGDVRVDNSGQIIGHSPVIKADDGSLYDYNDVMGPDRKPTGEGRPVEMANVLSGLPAPQASVASTLVNAGLPAPVVAGFLGNFDVEGGYGGARGDGGSASGLGQWRNDRAANFEKVIGKPIGEATHEDQAKFVLWEMQNPQAAGMTTEQRDAILAARTAPEAATLIDKFYERSSGEHRDRRVAAATGYANVLGGQDVSHPTSGGLKPLLPGKPREAPSGFRWSEDGTHLETIPGGPADDVQSYKLLSPAEAEAQGLDPNTKYQINTKTGQITPLGGQQRQAKQIPQTVQTKAQASIDVRDTMARLAGTWKKDYGGHLILGDNLNTLQRTLGSFSGAPEGMANWWADYQSMDNLVRNQLFGSALTEHEKQAYAATTISPKMDPGEIVKRFNRRRAIINGVTARQKNFLKKNGYDPEAVDALFQPLGGNNGEDSGGDSGAAPVSVRSVQQAMKLPVGTLYVAPDGKVRRR